MAPRPSWKGFLKLSLVSVPVRAFTANNTSEDIRLNQLHEECNARVKYQKVCPEHGELKSTDIVSGYEFADGQYVVIDPQDIQKLRKESDKSINIDGFVSPDDVDPTYYAGRNYYLLPDGVAGNKPYALLQQSMIDSNVWALGQVIISGREQLALIRTVDNMLVMTLVYYAKKIKAMDEFTKELEDQELSDAELSLTKTLIDASTIEELDFDSYKDGYVENLTKLIQLKVDGQEIVQTPDPEEPVILNLMEALKKSVSEAQAAGAGKKKVAPSSKKKAQERKRKSG